MAKIKIKLTRSKIKITKNQRLTLEALGLHKINSVREHEDNASTRGMIKVVNHMVEVVE
ncbi:MAG: 50S ribosomal protein L30 [Paludibacteraceae bacterium]|jgi:large subunit ribosomal protein L30|nr:50S ribosomal protein L30 [Paludibacteraceae bacterium]